MAFRMATHIRMEVRPKPWRRAWTQLGRAPGPVDGSECVQALVELATVVVGLRLLLARTVLS
jgi:hypothetical protein